VRNLRVGLAAATIAAAICGAGWIAWRGFSLLSQDNLSVSDEAASLQAMAAAAVLAATLALVGVTVWYAWLTRLAVRQSGPVVTVELRVGWVVEAARQGQVFVGPLSSLKAGPPDARFQVPFFAVKLWNSGNTKTSIDKVQIGFPSGFAYMTTHTPVGPNCPFPLEAHSSETYFLEAPDNLEGLEAMRKVSRKIRAEVDLGSGSTVHSSWEQLP